MANLLLYHHKIKETGSSAAVSSQQKGVTTRCHNNTNYFIIALYLHQCGIRLLQEFLVGHVLHKQSKKTYNISHFLEFAFVKSIFFLLKDRYSSTQFSSFHSRTTEQIQSHVEIYGFEQIKLSLYSICAAFFHRFWYLSFVHLPTTSTVSYNPKSISIGAANAMWLQRSAHNYIPQAFFTINIAHLIWRLGRILVS